MDSRSLPESIQNQIERENESMVVQRDSNVLVQSKYNQDNDVLPKLDDEGNY